MTAIYIYIFYLSVGGFAVPSVVVLITRHVPPGHILIGQFPRVNCCTCVLPKWNCLFAGSTNDSLADSYWITVRLQPRQVMPLISSRHRQTNLIRSVVTNWNEQKNESRQIRNNNKSA